MTAGSITGTAAGVGGRIDLKGRVFRKHTDDTAAVEVADAAPQATKPKLEIDFDFELALREGSVWPTEGTFAIAGLQGKILRMLEHFMDAPARLDRPGYGQIAVRL